MSATLSPEIQTALAAIAAGQALVFPTETLYALGGNGLEAGVAARVAAIKGRPEDKPLPLVIGSLEQLEQVGQTLPAALERLAAAFWPGPLSVLVESRPDLPPGVRDGRGLTSVRWTAHPLAAELCRLAGVPLIATSANVSGRRPASRPNELEAAVVWQVGAVLAGPPWPRGGAPSTVVRCLDAGRLALVRQGAVSLERLVAAGFEVLSEAEAGENEVV